MVCPPPSSVAELTALGLTFDDLPPAAGTVVVSVERDRALVVLSGEVDIACSPQTDAACTVVERLGGPVVVDASRVTFMDAAALGDLLRLRRAAATWELRRASPAVLRMLELTRLTEVLAAPARAASA
ncbi:STAS domain-containing protein [Quadrisphaera sp. DSM 44207]|uniref:STAS domain-containing protein n=1 Tax=Quadrisphaera sp. DSM 44207 TaxID=1881057 RepID=UPI0008829632|nr:STAS domain-containing protein [Quadrisphaera sp. DSM 44207]SDQ63804.1 anti-anti-sigma factor [Quadrisphaera sp. DSM 44207]